MKERIITILRFGVLIAVLVNQALATFGSAQICESTFYQILSLVCTVIVSAYTAWKNNDFTQTAILAGKIFDSLKDGSISKEEAEKIIEEAEEKKSE